MQQITPEEYRRDMNELKAENRIQTLFVFLAFFFSVVTLKDLFK